jgi:hypothetical protein
VRKIQSAAFSTPRVSVHGRPRPSGRVRGRKIGSSTAHCLSVRSMPARYDDTALGVYEMTSSDVRARRWCDRAEDLGAGGTPKGDPLD